MHVAVVGGGVIGLCTALYCARRGWRVTVIERNGAERDGCSYQNGGMVVPSHFVPLAAPGMVALGLRMMWNPASPFYIKPRASLGLADWALKFWRASSAEHVRRAAPLLRDLTLASRDCYEELAAEADDFGFVKSGMLLLCKTPHVLEEEAATAEYARELGIAADVLDAAGVAALEPGIRMDVAGGVHYPLDCRLAPDRLMASLQRRLAASGVKFLWNTSVDGFIANGRIRAARTPKGEVEADEFVVSSGSWSPTLMRGLGVKLPMQAGKGYSLTLPHTNGTPRMGAILAEARMAVTPIGGALRFGGTMELAGLNEDINPIRVRGIIDAVPRYYPDIRREDFDGVQPWRGLRPCTPDGLPYLGRPASVPNLVVAAGYAMLGVSLGPITGRLAAGMLSGEKPELDISLLSPNRYH
ncbi:MAG TPA: FAD-dependent oxidoreductase [Burkholderiales bacterium]|nr:FAD-dependent oxidoreductase [Burkholderiales bacterium]